MARRWERATSGRGPIRPDRWRTGSRQVATHRRVSIRLAETPHTWVEWSAVAAAAEYPAAPGHRMGPATIRRAESPREQRLADLEGTLAAHRPRPSRTCPVACAARRHRAAARSRFEFPPEELRRRQLAAMTAWVVAGARIAAGRAHLRGPSLGRPDLARPDARSRRARRAGAAAHPRDHAARVSTAMELALPSQRHLAAPP